MEYAGMPTQVETLAQCARPSGLIGGNVGTSSQPIRAGGFEGLAVILKDIDEQLQAMEQLQQALFHRLVAVLSPPVPSPPEPAITLPIPDCPLAHILQDVHQRLIHQKTIMGAMLQRIAL